MMITRVYIDNYKCFSNFEYRPAKSQLLLGLNGSGKSTILGVLRMLRSFVSEGKAVDELSGPANLTKWDTRDRQEFELEVEGKGGTYRYRAAFEHSRDRSLCRVADESLEYQSDAAPAWKYLFAADSTRGTCTVMIIAKDLRW